MSCGGGGAKGFLAFLEGPSPPMSADFVPTKLPTLQRQVGVAKSIGQLSGPPSPEPAEHVSVTVIRHGNQTTTRREAIRDAANDAADEDTTDNDSSDAALTPTKSSLLTGLRSKSSQRLHRLGLAGALSPRRSLHFDSVEQELAEDVAATAAAAAAAAGEPPASSKPLLFAASPTIIGADEEDDNRDVNGDDLSTLEVLRNAGIQSTCRQLIALEEKNFLLTASRQDIGAKIRQVQKELAQLEQAMTDIQEKAQSLRQQLCHGNDYRDKLQLCTSIADLQQLVVQPLQSTVHVDTDNDDLLVSTLRLNDDGTIRGGTVRDLVEMVTNNLFFSARFNTAFLKTFNGFTSSDLVFSLLLERWNITPDQVAVILRRQKRLQLNAKVVDLEAVLAATDDESTSSTTATQSDDECGGDPARKNHQPMSDVMSALQVLNNARSPSTPKRKAHKPRRKLHKNATAALAAEHADVSASSSSGSEAEASSSAPSLSVPPPQQSTVRSSSQPSLQSPSSSPMPSSPPLSPMPTSLSSPMPTSPLPDCAPSDADVQRVRTQIRLRVLAFTKQWLKESWDKDFDGSPGLVCRLVLWLDSSIADGDKLFVPTLRALRAHILRALFDAGRAAQPVVRQPFSVPKDFPVAAPSDKHLEQLDVFALEPLEFAKQLTVYEEQLFHAIRTEEFFDQNWNKPHKVVTAPNLTRLITRINVTSAWVSTSICSVSSKKHRVAKLEKWIRIAAAAREIGNLNCVMEILSGLGQTAIYRLKRTWASLDQRLHGMYSELRALMSPTSNFANYRRLLRRTTGPCIPYVGSLLTDLTFLDEAMPKYLDDPASSAADPIVNFHKYQKVHAFIDLVAQFQAQHYNYQPIESVQAYLQTCIEPSRFAADTVLLTVSKVLEP